MPTRSGPRPDPGAAVAGGGEEGDREKTSVSAAPTGWGGLLPSRQAWLTGQRGRPGGEPLPCRFGKSSRPRPGPPRLISLGRCWAGRQDHPDGIGLAAFRASETSSQFPASEAAEPQQVASVAGGVLEQNAGRGPPALGWRTVWSLKASAYGEVPKPRTGRWRCGVCLPRRAAWACATLAPGQGVGTGGRWLPTGRCVLSPQCFSFKTNYPRSNTVTFYIEICMSASL